VIKDLRNRVLYYRGYEDHALRAIHLTKLDLRPEVKRLSFIMPVGGGIIDITDDVQRTAHLDREPGHESMPRVVIGR
jgi:hypothetical protein